jgi:hypothetical protein
MIVKQAGAFKFRLNRDWGTNLEITVTTFIRSWWNNIPLLLLERIL